MSVLAFARATATPANNGNSPDVNATQITLANFANAVAQITAYSHAVLNTNLTPVNPGSEPSWFGTLTGNLDNMKTHAQGWVDTIGPSMTNVPQAIINFDNIFQGQYDTIIGLLQQIGGGTPTPLQKQNLLTLMGDLYTALQNQQTTITSVNTSLTQYNDNLSSDHTALTTGAGSITNAIQSDRDAVINLNNEITNLQAAINNWSQIGAASEFGIGVSLLVGLVGIGVAVFTLGAGTIIIVGAVVGLGASIAGTVVADVKIGGAQAQILSDQDSLSDDNKQIVILNGVASTVNGLVATNQTAATAMSDVMSTWATLTTKMGSVITDLQTAEGDIGSILDEGDMKTTKEAWTQLMNFATGMQQSLGNITLEPPQMIQTAAAA